MSKQEITSTNQAKWNEIELQPEAEHTNKTSKYHRSKSPKQNKSKSNKKQKNTKKRKLVELCARYCCCCRCWFFFSPLFFLDIWCKGESVNLLQLTHILMKSEERRENTLWLRHHEKKKVRCDNGMVWMTYKGNSNETFTSTDSAILTISAIRTACLKPRWHDHQQSTLAQGGKEERQSVGEFSCTDLLCCIIEIIGSNHTESTKAYNKRHRLWWIVLQPIMNEIESSYQPAFKKFFGFSNIGTLQ